jgi:hypothetical protein
VQLDLNSFEELNSRLEGPVSDRHALIPSKRIRIGKAVFIFLRKVFIFPPLRATYRILSGILIIALISSESTHGGEAVG